MMEDRIEISNRYYCIESTEQGEEAFSSKIYREKAGSRELIAEHTEDRKKEGSTEMTLRTLHQKVLAAFFNTMKKNGHNKEDELATSLQKALVSASQNSKELRSKILSNKNKTVADKWEHLCTKYLPGDAYAVYMIDSGKLTVYSTEGYASDKDQETVLEINKYFALNRQRINRIIGNFKVLTCNFEKQQYFYFSPVDTLAFVVAMPHGNLGIYLKELERFKEKILY